jgi:hypothetical protein
MGWVGPQATSHIYFFIDTIFIMGYCRNRAVIGDIAVIGKCKASLMGPPNAGRRDPESNCIVKMSGGDVTRNSQGYGFFLFFLGRVGPKPTSTYNRHANRELFFLGGWARRSQAGCDKLSQRHYVTLTQHLAVRGYVTLTSESRDADGGARLVVFNSD